MRGTSSAPKRGLKRGEGAVANASNPPRNRGYLDGIDSDLTSTDLTCPLQVRGCVALDAARQPVGYVLGLADRVLQLYAESEQVAK